MRDVLIVSTEGINARFLSKARDILNSHGWSTTGTVYDHPDYHRIGLTIVDMLEHQQVGYSFFVDGFGLGDVVWTYEVNLDDRFDVVMAKVRDHQDNHPGFE